MFFFSFDISQINNDDEINMFITDALDWFEYEYVGIEDEIIEIPDDFSLNQNYPNPFNPTTTISFSVAQTSSLVTLDIYNIKGQKVKQLVSDQLSAGQHTVTWDGKDENGKSATSGIYFYQLKAEKDFSKTKRMILLK